jgi:predicted secreted protein
MYRKKQIIYIAHCVLNQNSVIREWERAQGAFNDIVRVILDNNISIVQLPCPEFIFLGESRPPKTKSEYNTYEYRELCSELAAKTLSQMKEYLQHDYKIIGILGIEESPSCDSLGEKGVFMEELLKSLDSENIKLPTFDIPEKYIEGQSKEIVGNFKKFIEI